MRTIEMLQKEGRKLLREGKTWDEISLELMIFKKSGGINPGMAYRIVMEGYEPKRIETRSRLGLSIICPTCHRLVGIKKPNRRKDLFGMSKKELLSAFENRQEVGG